MKRSIIVSHSTAEAVQRAQSWGVGELAEAALLGEVIRLPRPQALKLRSGAAGAHHTCLVQGL